MPSKTTFKIVVAGDGGVGKTTLLYRYVEDRFSFDTKMTIGVEIFRKTLTFDSGSSCALQIWDFSGQERFQFLIQNFVMGAKGALVLFDLTKSPRFLTRVDDWVEIVKSQNKNIPMVLVGTKADLKEKILINEDAVLDLMEKHNFLNYYLTSSKTGFNVSEAFNLLTSELVRRIEERYSWF
ncbi:MAG: Rab family GTPase [Promethearchaeota archaeon]